MMTMEAQLYDDQPNPWLDKKKSMKLDLCTQPTKKSYAVLSTPDVQMLKLASPELEKLIMSQQGTVITTPTPTSILCPKNVTLEQEQFAEGFVQALSQLHGGVPSSTSATTTLPSSSGTLHYPSQASVTTTTTSLPGSASVDQPMQPVSSTASTCVTSPRRNNGTHDYIGTIATVGVQRIKQEEAPQTVPVFLAKGTPPTSPIDMEMQERFKAERKRLRNRIAASKCRKRKLERISRLEEKVDDLKNQNSDLSLSATQLREQVCKLKQQVMEHVKSGCQVMLAQQLAF
ncbi:AP1-like transcription factor [Saccoglossus kowalevskii]|uniref:AP1-like transcription factor n=1 Tax=Saccoglossus kowalevskii TaxID=10224 RepID=D1LWW3_SACKO|nr:AP1-like transcription factor [Saccoglossus kowalevskii]ACY92469.1 AP1-like transcription factor [Saccoglossus kowalevskii]ALR88681.1 transcription factor ap-1-like 359 [Saccoglossus kowalevskii]